MLREVTVKIGLERRNMQEEITVEALLDSGATGLVMSSEFARKQGFKLKKLDRREKYGWIIEQRRTYRTCGESKYILSRS